MESIIPESLRALTRWPKSPRTLGTRLTHTKSVLARHAILTPKIGMPLPFARIVPFPGPFSQDRVNMRHGMLCSKR